MEIFSSVIFQIAVLFSFIFIGFTIRQGGFLPENSAEIFSKLENRILMPAVVINTFRTNCTVKKHKRKMGVHCLQHGGSAVLHCNGICCVKVSW